MGRVAREPNRAQGGMSSVRAMGVQGLPITAHRAAGQVVRGARILKGTAQKTIVVMAGPVHAVVLVEGVKKTRKNKTRSNQPRQLLCEHFAGQSIAAVVNSGQFPVPRDGVRDAGVRLRLLRVLPRKDVRDKVGLRRVPRRVGRMPGGVDARAKSPLQDPWAGAVEPVLEMEDNGAQRLQATLDASPVRGCNAEAVQDPVQLHLAADGSLVFVRANGLFLKERVDLFGGRRVFVGRGGRESDLVDQPMVQPVDHFAQLFVPRHAVRERRRREKPGHFLDTFFFLKGGKKKLLSSNI